MASQWYRVLLVDDSPEDRASFRRFLEHDQNASFTCYEAGTVAEALAHCREIQPDAVLIDHQLPDDEGLGLIAALVGTYGANAFAMILLTGHGSEQLAVAAMKLGTHDYLVKSQHLQYQLGRAVIRAIERAQLQRELAQQHRELAESHFRLQQALASVSEQRRLLNVTLASIGDGVISVDAGGRVAFLNPEAERLTGWSYPEAQSLPAETVFQIISEQTRAPATGLLDGLLSGQAAAPSGSYVLIAHDHRETPISLTIAPIQQSGGAIEGAVLVFRDISAQKQAEASLRMERDRFFKLTETVPGVVHAFRLWPDGRSDFPYTSSRITEIYGMSPELLARDASGVSAHWHADDAARILDSLRQSHQHLAPWHEEFRVLHPERGEIWIDGHSIPQPQEDGSIIWYGVLTDITERRHSMLALLASEQRRKLALQAGLLGTWEWNPLAHTVEIDTTSMQLFGLTEETFSGRDDAIFAGIHPDDLAAMQAALQASLEQGSIYNHHFRWRMPDGSLRWIQSIGKASYGAGGAVLGFYGLMSDITERKQIEHERERARQRSQVLADASRSFAEAGTDVQALLEYMAKTVASQLQALCIVRLLSDDGEWLEAATFYHTDPTVMAAMQNSAMSASLRTDSQTPPAIVFRTGQALMLNDYQLADTSSSTVPAGLLEFWRRFQIHSIINVLLRAQGHTLGTLALLRLGSDQPFFDEEDLALAQNLADRAALAMSNASLVQQLAAERATLARRVEERTADLSIANAELARTARLKDEFLASMSHELRTPLNSILGRSEALQEEIYGALTQKQVETLRGIEASGRHLLALINDILDLSKIEADALDLQIEPVLLDLVCRSALQMVAQAARRKRIVLSSTIDSLVETLPADERRLKQVLVNLLSNAVKFTPEGGKVGLEVLGEAAQQRVTFTVWDTGIGIAQEDLPRLFKPFVQIDSRLNRQFEGTGLGLALVLRLVQAHGGSVAVASTPGQGSRFSVTLPWDAQQQQAAPESAERAGAAPALPLRQALVVEDSQSAAEQIQRYLGDLGARAELHTLAGGAIARARELQPDLIMLDILLPDAVGWELLRQLKAEPRTRNIPVIIVSVVDEPERARALGAAAFLVKPIGRATFLSTLQRLGYTVAAAGEHGGGQAVARAAPKILLAEDNQATIDVMEDYLQAKGYEVVVARNGAEALAHAQEAQPALILMDIQMPGMDGLEAIGRLRADDQLRGIPIIAVTALAMPGDRERCLAAGADDYLTKPVNLRALLATIQTHIHQR